MTERRAISKTMRFEIFKRDSFTCQYCGRKPPAVVLEVDHVIAVSDGGHSEEHNLLTACFDCNRGKGSRPIEPMAPLDLEERGRLIAEREAQVAAYEELLASQRAKADAVVDTMVAIYEAAFPEWTLKDSARISIRRFLEKLPPSEVREAMELACGRVNSDRAFRYFCGVCWNKIKDGA